MNRQLFRCIFCSEAMRKVEFFRDENGTLISLCEWVRSLLALVVRVSFWLCKKALFSSNELICEFSEQCLIIFNFCFRLFLVLSTCLGRVCRSYNFERKIWLVQVANLHSVARALSCPSRCQKLDKRFFSPSIVLRCCDSLRQHYKATKIMCVSSTKWNFILEK